VKTYPRNIPALLLGFLIAISPQAETANYMTLKASSGRQDDARIALRCGGVVSYVNLGAFASALKADAFNSIKDVLTSVTAFVGIALSEYLDIKATDAIAGIIIAFFVFTMAYSVVKESSLVLMDACQCSDILMDIENIARSLKHVKGVHDIRMRKLGQCLIGDMHIVVDGKMSVREADQIATQIEEQVKKEFDEVTEIKVRIEPPKPRSTDENSAHSFDY